MRKCCRVRVLSLLVCACLQLGLAGFAAANEDVDALFSTGDLVSEISDDGYSKALDEDLLTSEGVEIGGKYNFSLGSIAKWDSPDSLGQHPGKPDKEQLDTNLQASIYLDARPDKDYRVFGKARISYPFSEQAANSPGQKSRSFNDIVQVTELFSDFNHDGKVFFRAGKQNISWGVGYFMSPADIINLTPIDPNDPEAEREGPLSLKINAPVGNNNLYLYLLADNASSIRDIAVAPKAEIVLKAAELGLGAFYQRDRAPMAMATISSALGDFAAFGEGVVKYGSDRHFVQEGPLGLSVGSNKNTLFWQATGGIRYAYTDDDGLFNLSIATQYFYNGEGNDNPKLVWLATLDPVLRTKLSPSDFTWIGKQYLATSVAWRDVLKSDVSANAFALSSLTDKTGALNASLSWEPIDKISTSLGVMYNYGPKGGEYTPTGNGVTVSLRASIGSGQF